MWGQGIAEGQKFKHLIAAELGRLHARTPSIVVDRSRSGAQLLSRASGDDKEDPREAFLDTFAGLFTTAAMRKRFRSGTDESPAERLFGEIPATYPTIDWQVDAVPADLGKKIDVVLLTGGANDIGFDTVINPREFPGEFIQKFEGQIQSIAYGDTLAMLGKVRAKCPRAIIMLFGYFAPINYPSHVGKLRNFFKHELDDPFGWAINRLVKVVDVEAAIREARIRSVWAASRAQHWMRSAVTEANHNDALRGPGILFVPSAINGGSAAFANDPKVAGDYENPTSDPVRAERVKKCPRADLLGDLQSTWQGLSAPPVAVSRRFETLLKALITDGGPASLISAMRNFKDNPANTNFRSELAQRLQREIHRIQRALIASFLHPNTAGAKQYADNAVERYRDHRDLMAKIKTMVPSRGPVAAPVGESFDAKLQRYRVRGPGRLEGDIGHLNVDAIFVRAVTARTSDAKLTPDISLVVGTKRAGSPKQVRVYRMNFPYHFQETMQLHLMRKVAPDFEPATTTIITIDTLDQLRLDEITSVQIRLGQDPLAGKVAEPHGTTWRPRRVYIEFNGLQVVDTTLQDPAIGPGGSLDLAYPPPPPRSGGAATTGSVLRRHRRGA